MQKRPEVMNPEAPALTGAASLPTALGAAPLYGAGLPDWTQDGRESNPEPPDLESGALPVELPTYEERPAPRMEPGVQRSNPGLRSRACPGLWGRGPIRPVAPVGTGSHRRGLRRSRLWSDHEPDELPCCSIPLPGTYFTLRQLARSEANALCLRPNDVHPLQLLRAGEGAPPITASWLGNGPDVCVVRLFIAVSSVLMLAPSNFTPDTADTTEVQRPIVARWSASLSSGPALPSPMPVSFVDVDAYENVSHS